MSLFANFALLSLLVVMVGLATISGIVMTRSIQEEDAVTAWIWMAVLGATSLVAALTFGRLV